MGHSFLLSCWSLRSTMLPGSRLGWLFCHFLLGCSVEIDYCLHLLQKVWARCWTWCHCCLQMSLTLESLGGTDGIPIFWVRRVAGVSRTRSFGSADSGMRGLALMIAATSAISVVSTSCQVWCLKLRKHWIEDPSGYSYHLLPWATHVRHMGRVKDPWKAFVC